MATGVGGSSRVGRSRTSPNTDASGSTLTDLKKKLKQVTSVSATVLVRPLSTVLRTLLININFYVAYQRCAHAGRWWWLVLTTSRLLLGLVLIMCAELRLRK